MFVLRFQVTFSVPGFMWERGLPLENCQICSKRWGDGVYTCIYFLGLGPCADADCSSDMTDLFISNIIHLRITFAYLSMVKTVVNNATGNRNTFFGQKSVQNECTLVSCIRLW